jgi:outer membrane protein assembly factor BamB
VFEGGNKAVLYRVDAPTGETILETGFWEGKERYYPRKIYPFGTNYIIDADALDYRHIKAINSETGLVSWELELDKDLILQSKEVDIVWSDSLVMIPLDGELQAYDLYSGQMKWSYDYTDDIDGIKYLNQSGVGRGAISFLSDDDEFTVLNIKTRQISYKEDVNFDGMVRIQYLDAKYILGYNNNGYIALFEKNANGVKNVWTRDVNKIEKLILSRKYIHVFNPNNYSTVNFQNGEMKEEVPLIWRADNIFINNKSLGCFTGKKLYLINL